MAPPPAMTTLAVRHAPVVIPNDGGSSRSCVRSTPSMRAAPRARIVPNFESADLFSGQLPTQLPSHSYSDRTRERA
jgi:hypothetical protein